MHRLLICGLLLMNVLPALAQPTSQGPDALIVTQQRIAALRQKMDSVRTSSAPRQQELQATCAINCAEVSAELDALWAKKREAMAEIAAQMEREVDAYISKTVDPKVTEADRKRLTTNLAQILGKDVAAIGPPRAFAADLPSGLNLVVVYSVGGGTAVNNYTVVRAFKPAGRHLVPGAVTGSDMNNYGNLSVFELHSPVANELWLLIRGQALGANGPNMRMRLYAYGRKGFRTEWMPANVWGNIGVTVKDDGFRLDGPYYHQETELHEIYQVTPQGLYMSPASAPSGRVK